MLEPILASNTPQTLRHPKEAQPQPSGLWVVLGFQDPSLLLELAAHSKGQAMIQALSTHEEVVKSTRRVLAEKGWIPLVDVRHVDSYEHLPYTNELITVLVINEAGLEGNKVPESEITRTVFFDRPVLRGSGTRWKMTFTEMPEDVDEWTHMLHGPTNIPYSQDHRTGPWITGLRFMVGDHEEGRRQNILASRSTRLSGGRMFVLNSKGRNTLYRALDAANGLPLWQRNVVELSSSRTRRVPGDEVVIGYFNETGPMLKLDAATGKELMAYDQGLSLEIGERFRHGKEFGKRTQKEQGVLYESTAQVLLQEDTVIQVYGNQVVRLDKASGRKVWGYQAPKGQIEFATMDKDGHVYLMVEEDVDVEHKGQFIVGPGVALTSLDAKSGKPRWSLDLQNHNYADKDIVGFFPKTITGPGDGIIWMGGHPLRKDDRIGRVGSNWFMFINSADGTVIRERRGATRAMQFMIDGQMFHNSAYTSFGFSDPLTGNEIDRVNAYAQPGGCGINSITPKYVLRGQMLHSRENLDQAFASSGFRPHCEAPMMPGYGALYSGQSGICGCGWYLPTAYVKAGAHYSQPEKANPTTKPASLVGTGFQGPEGPLVENWHIVKSSMPSAKSERMSPIPKSVQLTLRDAIGGKKSAGDGHWYGIGPTPYLFEDDVTYWVDVHTHRLHASPGGKVWGKEDAKEYDKQIRTTGRYTWTPPAAPIWTAVLDGRISTAPILVDGTLIAATHAGALYGLDPKTGITKWRTQIAPNDLQMMAFGQLESLWPCFGVIEHKGRVHSIAGRISSLDQGLFAAAVDPGSGKLLWRVRQAADPVEFTRQSKQIPEARGWGTKRGSHDGQPFSRGYMSANIPPQITRNHLHAAGMLMVDVDNPEDFVHTYSSEFLQKLPELPE